MPRNSGTADVMGRAVVGRTEAMVGRRLCRDEAEAVVMEVLDEHGDDCPDRVLSEVASVLFGRMELAPRVAHSVSDSVDDVVRAAGRLRRMGMAEGRHFELGRVAGLEVLFWRMADGVAGDILREDATAAPSLGRAMRPYMPHMGGMPRPAIMEFLMDAVANTMPLTSGARILRKASEMGEAPLQRYVLNLFLLRDDMERRAAERRGWGNDFAINRVNPNQMAVQYLSFQDLAPLYPSSDMEQPIDTMRQEEQKHNQEDGRRRPSKIKRRLGDER